MLCSGLVILLDRRCVDLDTLGLNDSPDLLNVSLRCLHRWSVITHSLLESGQVSWAEGIRLCNNWNQVDSAAQSLHNLNVQWLQGMSSRSDEVQTCVNTEIDLVNAARLLLLEHVRLMLVVQKLDDGHP
jgi:hypothetical protein